MLGRSFKVAVALGVPIRVHWTLALLLVALAIWAPSILGPQVLLPTLGWVVALFGSVLLHELGHVWCGRRFGIRTHAIVLSPVGGMAEMDQRRVSPRVDAMVSMAGPMASLGVALSCFVLAGVTGQPMWRSLGGLNLLLGAFNLLPIYPLDGGRMLRAAMSARLGAARAHDASLRVGALVIAVATGAALATGVYDGAVFGLVLLVLLERERRIFLAVRGARPS
jgi:stage IV sporulation protein FB